MQDCTNCHSPNSVSEWSLKLLGGYPGTDVKRTVSRGCGCLHCGWNIVVRSEEKVADLSVQQTEFSAISRGVSAT